MIIDKISNIKKYIQIPHEVATFISSLTKNIKEGKYFLTDNNYVNIETYVTKGINNAKYEAHNKYIDIQLLMDGSEYIYVEDRDKLTTNIPYSEDKDITFFKDDINIEKKVLLDSTNFVMLFPHEAHAPQVLNTTSMKVKKVVVKVKV